MLRLFLLVFSFFALFFLTLYGTKALNAQTPSNKSSLVITWKSGSFFPANFTGKAPATPFSPIIASVEAVSGGKILNLSRAAISWKIDNKPIGNGAGMKNVSFRVQKNKGDFHILSVSVSQNDSVSEDSVIIPIYPQIIVVELPFKDNTISPGVENAIKAVPYFFNIDSIKNISFFWQINNENKGGGNNDTLILKTGEPQLQSQETVEITASAQNNNNPLEFAKSRAWLKISR